MMLTMAMHDDVHGEVVIEGICMSLPKSLRDGSAVARIIIIPWKTPGQGRDANWGKARTAGTGDDAKC
jgi:hypothetical protein